LAGVGVALGVVLGVVLKTKTALRWGLGLFLFRASSQCNQGGPKSQEPRGGLSGLPRTYIHNTDTEEPKQAGQPAGPPGQRERKQQGPWREQLALTLKMTYPDSR
jgi:hypothetical protein